MIHKTNRLLLKFGGSLWRKLFGAGESRLPMWGKYFEILKKAKGAFDSANLMYPDVLPLTDDYVCQAAGREPPLPPTRRAVSRQ